MSIIFKGENSTKRLAQTVKEMGIKRPLVVCGGSVERLPIKSMLSQWPRFSGFTTNPEFHEILRGVKAFFEEKCDAIIAVGGGSAIDTAKCIAFFSMMDQRKDFLEQKIDRVIPFVAIPTTAGTGSEATCFAVVYRNREKLSVEAESLIPDIVFLDGCLLRSLPIYQKKCTMLDALCQAIESWWSVHSNVQSRQWSKLAVRRILDNLEGYFIGDESCQQNMLEAAYDAGRAINQAKTTAAHAMSYRLTARYSLPHGHAVAICLTPVWRYMLAHIEDCCDPRGTTHVKAIFQEIAVAMGTEDAWKAADLLEGLVERLSIMGPKIVSEKEIQDLVSSVNLQRLKNNPVRLDCSALYSLYKIIGGATGNGGKYL